MNKALEQAKKAFILDEVPVGAIIVKDNKIIALAHNKKESDNNCTSHAEILAIKKASKKLKDWRLIDCSIYVTLEPCTMCLGALIHSRIKNVFYGAIDLKSGACGGLYTLLDQKGFNHYPAIEHLDNKDCSLLLKQYFEKKRNKLNIKIK